MSERDISSDRIFSFGPFRLLPAQRLLLEGDKPVRLGSRALEILIALVEHPGEVVGKDELIARAWPGTFVEESNLKFQVSALRRTLGDVSRYLATIPGRGYSFVGPVNLAEEATPAPTQAGATAHPNNLPAQLTRLIGRADIIEKLAAQLPRQRLLTIVGPGGIGKTSVALAVAEGRLTAYEHGVWLVDLELVDDARLVPSVLATVLGLEIPSESPLPSLIAGLSDKKMLLLFDNCAHVIEAAASLAIALLRGVPAVHILATSREPLRVEGERVFRLPPLASPPASAGIIATEALGYPAVQLFVERAAASLDEFDLSDTDAPHVVEICRRLDGLPLAIEFAAARVEALGIHGVAAHLDERFRLLTTGRRAAVPRHRTLSATLDWSYQLLSEDERRVLRSLAIFAGSFTLEAAGAVAADDNHPAGEVMDQVAELVAKSLVVAEVSGAEPRLRLLETTRAYALNKLVDSGEQRQTARRYADYSRALFERAEVEWQVFTAEYGRHIDDLRAALDWAFSPGGDLAWWNFVLGDERTLPDVESERGPRRVQLLIATGIALILLLGSVERTKMVVSQALDLAKSLGDVHAQIQALRLLWNVHSYCGECDTAKSIAEQLVGLTRQAGDSAGIALSDRMTGLALLEKGRLGEAQRCFESLLHQHVPPHQRGDTLWFVNNQRILAGAMLARVLWLQGLVDQAVKHAGTALELAQAADHKLSICAVYGYAVCPLALMGRDFAAAERAMTRLIDLATDLHHALWRLFGGCLEGRLLIGRGEFATGLASLQNALDVCDRTGWTITNPQLLGARAEGLAGVGQLTEALAAIDQALARGDRTGELWYKPELLRIKGEVLLQQESDRSIAAEDCFRAALELARGQGALIWELRIATSLARLHNNHGRKVEGRDLLAEVYGRFTEGFGTTDLQSAKQLLDELA